MSFSLLPHPSELGFPELSRVVAERNILEIITLIMKYAQIALLVLIIIGGIQWMFSFGDSEKIGKARSTLLSAIVGYFIIVISLPVVSAISTFFQK